MSENTVHATELSSQYIAQVTSDLERNTKEQERLTAEIDALQQQLTALKRDHELLVSVQQALGNASLPAPQTAGPETPTVPTPRKRSSSASGAGRTAKAKKTTATAKPATAKPATAKSAAAKSPAAKPAAATQASAKQASAKPAAARKTAAKKAPKKASPAQQAQPTLVELVRGHLTEQKEPRSAAEIATALSEIHPERAIKSTVVRTTLEGLVAKNQAQRSKQGSSVYYTASEAPEPDPAQEAKPQAEEEKADS
ncbi:hypothetical protein ACWC10_04555 [Streptomyces sp. NPDC001595]|uniref:hypothetical protein n=1 Tax=Streptomyces sp. NPDC001532 TaxID=3154520 RepID=UPI00332E077E